MKKIFNVMLILSIFILYSCKDKSTADASLSCRVITVDTVPIRMHESYSASIQGRQDIDIYPQVSGKITKLCVKEGQHVRKGEVLFVIDQVPYRAAWRKAVADVHAAQAQLATACLDYRSKQQLFNEKVVSDYDLSTAKNALDVAEATLEQMKALKENAGNDLSYTEVKSPSDGMVGTLPFRVGSLVSASMQEPLTTVSDNSQMFVYFSMTENQLRALCRQYGSFDRTLSNMPLVELELNDGTMYGHKGIIESISGVIDRQTGTATLRCVFPNEERLLLSGSVGNVIIPHTENAAIIIPQEAVTELQDKHIIYKVAQDGTLSSAEIKIDKLNDGKNYIVRSGLAAGDVIVAEGTGMLRDGMKITIKK